MDNRNIEILLKLPLNLDNFVRLAVSNEVGTSELSQTFRLTVPVKSNSKLETRTIYLIVILSILLFAVIIMTLLFLRFEFYFCL